MVVSTDSNVGLDDGFCWLPEGRIIYSRRESSDSTDDNLWQIGIDGETGTPTGKPKRITQWAGSSLVQLSASADGKHLALQKVTWQGQVYVGELAAGGTRMSPPRRLTNDEADDSPAAWTPDSKAVLFGSDRNGTQSIFKQGLSQDTADPVVTGQQGARSPRLSPDGAWILYLEVPKTAIGPSTPLRLMRIPVSHKRGENMKLSTILLTAFTLAFWFVWVPAFAQHGGGHGAGPGIGPGAGPGMNQGRGRSATSTPSMEDNESSRTMGKAAEELLTQNKNLSSKLQALLPPGTTVQDAAKGFKNLGQFIAAVHVSHNLRIPFDDLKSKMLSGDSLGNAIHDLKPEVSAKEEAKKAHKQAKETIQEASS